MEHPFDLIVVGAGSGGLAAAKRASSYGARVAIIEGDRVGGTCVIRGCVPKKLLVYGSQYKQYLKNAFSYGVKIDKAEIMPEILLENVRKEVDRLNKIHIDLLSKANVELINGWASLTSPNTVAIRNANSSSKDLELIGKYILIATGGRPVRPDIAGKHLGWVSDDVFCQNKLPDKIVVIGAGFIACEFACILNGLGIEVTQLVRGSNLLRGFDEEISLSLQDAMIDKGINIKFNFQANSLEGEIGDLIVRGIKEESIKSEAVLFATGREPLLERLNIDKINMTIKENRIAVDNRNRTNIPNIFAIGDVTNRINLTPVAIEEGRVFADNIFSNKDRQVNYNFIPKAVFSQPEIACVGMTEQQAVKHYGKKNIRIYKSKFRPMSKMLSNSKEKCLLKLLVLEKDKRIVGCHMIGENASEIIQMASVPIIMGATKFDFDNTMALHPTIAEEFVTMR